MIDMEMNNPSKGNKGTIKDIIKRNLMLMKYLECLWGLDFPLVEGGYFREGDLEIGEDNSISTKMEIKKTGNLVGNRIGLQNVFQCYLSF